MFKYMFLHTHFTHTYTIFYAYIFSKNTSYQNNVTQPPLRLTDQTVQINIEDSTQNENGPTGVSVATIPVAPSCSIQNGRCLRICSLNIINIFKSKAQLDKPQATPFELTVVYELSPI